MFNSIVKFNILNSAPKFYAFEATFWVFVFCVFLNKLL